MSITPYLYYRDVDAALTWLAKAFGFKKDGPVMTGSDGRTHHAAMKLGDDVVMMGWPGSKYKNPKRLGQATQSLYVMVANVDRHYERSRKAGAKVIQKPEDKEYGHRNYGVEDPEGHQWYFGQPSTTKRPARRRG